MTFGQAVAYGTYSEGNDDIAPTRESEWYLLMIIECCAHATRC
jgi:hypothetical protein